MDNSKMEEDLANLVLKPSRYAFIYQKNNDFAIYHSRLMETIYLSKESIDIFLRFKSGERVNNIIEEKGEEIKDLISKLIDTKILVLLKDNEERFSRNSYPKEEIDIRLMYFFPTDICNFRCSYCFIESAFPMEHQFSYMNEETAKRGLHLTESKIRRLVKYYKKTNKLPAAWKYDREQAKLLIG